MSQPEVVIAMYRPKEGKLKELEALVLRHFPTLKEYGLTTQSAPFIGRSADGTIIEVFEWASRAAAQKAHDHPAVAKIWEAMAIVSDFGTLKQMPEAEKMFGCQAMWAGDNVFAIVWKHGRIGFKLPDATPYQTLLDIKGAEPWKAGAMQMSHWVLVPESFHSKPTELRKWAALAHDLCAKLEKPAKRGAKAGKPTKRK